MTAYILDSSWIFCLFVPCALVDLIIYGGTLEDLESFLESELILANQIH